jgi:hypothetical protein
MSNLMSLLLTILFVYVTDEDKNLKQGAITASSVGALQVCLKSRLLLGISYFDYQMIN